MKKIALTAAALVLATGSAFAGNIVAGPNDADRTVPQVFQQPTSAQQFNGSHAATASVTIPGHDAIRYMDSNPNAADRPLTVAQERVQ